MNNTIVFLRSNPVNPDSRVEKEVYSLKKSKYNVMIIGWDREDNYKVKKDILNVSGQEIEIFRIGIRASYGEGKKNLIPFIKFQFFILKWLVFNRKKYEIIHACDFDTAFTANFSRIFTKKKLVFDIFDYLSTDANNLPKKILKKMEDNIINKATAVIICTEKRKEQIRGTKPHNLTIIHNTPHIDIKNINNNCFVFNQKNTIKIAYVGILQDFRLLLEMAEVIAKNAEYELHIGGFGKYHNYMQEMSVKYDNIYYYGKLTYEQTLSLENQCDIMVAIYDPNIGNHIYAAPNKFYESLMLGKPLIMVKNTGMSDVIEKNHIGVCIEYSAQSFETGLQEIVKVKNQWVNMSNKMKEIYREEYSWNVMEDRLIKLYRKIL